MQLNRIPITLMILCMLCGGCRENARRQEAASPETTGQARLVTATDEELVKQVIRRYNQLLADGYRALSMNRLGEVATPALAEKAYFHMAALGEGGTRMLSTLKMIDFVSLKGSRAVGIVVRTREIWDFSSTTIKTGAVISSEADFPYDVTYTLKLIGQRWTITDIVATSPRDSTQKTAPPTAPYRPSTALPAERGKNADQR